MPIYEFRCEADGYYAEDYRDITQRDIPMLCEKCGGPMKRLISKLAYQKPYAPGFHHQLQQTFHSKSEEQHFAKKHGMVDITGEGKALKHGRGRWRNQ